MLQSHLVTIKVSNNLNIKIVIPTYIIYYQAKLKNL